MAAPVSTKPVWRFGVFEVDAQRRELRRAGTVLKLREQSFQILLALLEHRGEIVTRDDLRQRLWPSDTFVDFDHSLNTAMMKLRDALGDLTDAPIYIETIPRRGYRFVCPVEAIGGVASQESSELPGPDPQTSASLPQLGAERRPSPRRRWLIAAVAFMCAVAALLVGLNIAGFRERATVAFTRAAAPRIESVAVLPFQNLSGDPSQEFFADGMTEELITELGGFGSFRVISRTSVMHLKGTSKPLPQIARELGVDGIVEGTVARSGNRVRITANFLQAANERHLWANSYESEVEDVLIVQSQVAHSVANAIRTEIARKRQIPAVTRRRVNPEAYQAYLEGRFYASMWAINGYSQTEKSLQRSLDLDPTFAPACSALSLFYFAQAINGVRPATELIPLARFTALKALELDDSLAEAHSALAVVKQSYDWDWAGAEQEHRRALELNPSSVDAHLWYAVFLTAMGRLDEAIREGRDAARLDPVSPFPNLNLGWSLYFARRHNESIVQLNQVLQLDPRYVWANMELAWNYAQIGMYPKAVAECEHALAVAPGNQIVVSSCGKIYGRISKRKEALALLDRMKSLAQKGYVNPYSMAELYDGLGDTEQAIEWLQRAYNERATSLIFLKIEFFSDRLRADSHFQALLAKLDFPS